MKEIEHQDLRGKLKSGKTMGRGAINPLYRRWYMETNQRNEQLVRGFACRDKQE